MSKYSIQPTGVERHFSADEFIVSKTNLKGHITYVNKLFMDIADYTEEDCLGKPHSVIRHPDMPRAIFHMLWEAIQAKKEIFAYVVNMAKNGDHYWVLAHVTPSYDADMQHIGYHSNRRVPAPKALDFIRPLYQELKSLEDSFANRKEGMEASLNLLEETLESKGVKYDEFIFSIG
ncbi:transcriptional regulator [Kordiimonas sediminis]|uniref:Transcriptional regulator n=1 Tax=Kordiimonas sediminis TaxID=1735581 RepID=A0A919E8U5_9PROT|nr:PAS domain-containing protein [Kordiimonas sediminis]GHF25712.1 transcriptional regulator [Kordiimonas sediminis]